MASKKIPYLLGVILAILFIFSSTKFSSVLSKSSPNIGSSANADFHLRSRSDDGSCSLSQPCSNGACCGGGSDGQLTYCGYGPTYCGDSCLSNCNATAACGQYAAIPNTTCPLNVCCSQFGFCGTTELFCTTKCQSNCVLNPTPPPGASSVDVRQKVIAYYEAWSSTRTCQTMLPGGLPVDGLTHVNFAFAYLTPDTFEIVSMDSTLPSDLFQTVADVKTFKSGNQMLEVFVSIGGWDFTDVSSSTQPLFGEIAGDPVKRQLFCDNALKFVNEYGFDGLDIDWEYPGAPDRGGTAEDTANFVLLLKSLRETFDSYPRTLSITFTIPSSYWYLQYFDLPSMIEYADWMNLMSYDLHGVWDSSDPIGNQVQAHTNLTEIKLAVELLWRVNIPPARVVLGTGFYGRAFQLSDPTCNTPGCTFSGAADPGVCTDSAGTLAYFEIMDIINGDSAKSPVVHDAVDAVNYLTFDENQWVSFDNNVTFQQKVSWANGVGLGGLMIWSVDQDDSKFSALSGLLGRSIGGLGGDQQPIAIGQDWSGQNGQSCFAFTECVNLKNAQASSCGYGFTNIGYDAGGCGSGYGKPFCCPVNAAPRTCLWRGNGLDCDGQCHAGEVKLFGSSWGGEPTQGNQNKCSRGGKLFCCVADNWATALDDCYFSECNTGCSSGYSSVTWKIDPVFCAFPVGGHGSQRRDYCCPTPAKFGDCNWVGQGDCKDNACATDEVVLMTDKFGQTSTACGWKRMKTCCCPPPPEPDFLPVALSDVFPPTLPPSQDLVKYDLQFPKGGSNPSTADAFGWVLIVGPPAAVSNANKGKRGRSASHIEFINCHELSGTARQTVKFVCTARGTHSNCDDMMEGGIEGTILEMPDNCGAGKYVVAHAVGDSEDQSLPWYLESIKNTTVRELTFDYNFSLMKRDAGDVYIRMDYSNIPGYWDSIVKSSPSKRSLENRYYGTSDKAWGLKFQVLELAAHKLGGAAGTKFPDSSWEEKLLSFDKPCSSSATGSSSAFAAINARVAVSGTGYMGLSFIGILSATTQNPIKFIEAYSFVDTTIDTDVRLNVFVKGDFQVPYTSSTLTRSFAANGFNHPGLISVAPTLSYDIAFTADISLEANFSTGTHAWTNMSILQALPLDSQVMQGQTTQNNPYPFQGNVYAASGDMFKFDFRPRMGLNIEMDQFGTSDINFGAFAENSLDTYNAISFNPADSSFSVVQGTGAASGTVIFDVPGSEISAWGSNEDTDNVVNNAPGADIIWAGMPGEGDDEPGNGLPTGPTSISNDSSSLFWSVVDAIQCPNAYLNDSITISCPTSLCILIPDLCTDDDSETGDDDVVDMAFVRRTARLEKRAPPKNFIVPLGGNNTLSIWSQPWPSIGQLFVGPQGRNVLNRTFEYVDRNDCGEPEVIDFERPANYSLTGNDVTEHILELQTIPRWIRAATTGSLPSGRMMTAPSVPESFFINSWNGNSLPASVPNVGATFSSRVPNDRVFQTLGSNNNRVTFVATARDLNGVKANLWQLNRAMSPDTFNLNLRIALSTTSNQATRETARELILGTIRAAAATFNYLNDADISQRLLTTAAAVRVQIQLIESNIPAARGLTATWDEFLQDQFDAMVSNARGWMTMTIATVRSAYTTASPPPPDLAAVIGVLDRLMATIPTLAMPRLP